MDRPQIPVLDTPPVLGRLYSTKQVAAQLGVSVRTVQDWILEGALPAMRYGHLLRVREADLVAFGTPVSGRPSAVTAQEGSAEAVAK